MPYYKQLNGQKCYLSPIDSEDAEKYCKWLNDLNVSMYLDSHLRLTPETERELIKELSKNTVLFGIIDKTTDTLIGGGGLHDVHNINRTAMLGIFIGENDYWNKGYGMEATNLILDYGFNILNLHNIFLYVYDYNIRATKCYEKCGFKIIGKRREAKYFAGKYYDIILMDILAEEFKSIYISSLLSDK